MTPLEKFKEDYNSKAFFIRDLNIKEVKEVASSSYLDQLSEPTVVTLVYREQFLIYALILLAITLYYFRSSLYFFPLIPLLYIIYPVRALLRKKKMPQISVYADREKFVFQNESYLWADIVKGYIMVKQQGRGSSESFLLLEDLNGTIKSIEINELGISYQKLAAIVYYYTYKKEVNT